MPRVAERPISLAHKAAKLLDQEARARLARLAQRLREIGRWTAADLEAAVRAFAAEEGVKLGQVAQPLRAALTGSTASPGIFEVMEVLGNEETAARLGEF